MNDEYYMSLALKEAKKAYLKDEVPVGAVLVIGDKIYKAHNTREKDNLVISHAEINVIKKASKDLKDWQLLDSTLYVTLEPCIMCAGAIYQAHIKRVVYGAFDPKAGGLGSIINIYNVKELNFHPEVISGIKKEESSNLLKSFFKEKRKSSK